MMLDVSETELVFSFPDVNDGAVLRTHFRGADSPEACVRIIHDSAQGGYLLATHGRVVMHLRPTFLAEHLRSTSGAPGPGLRYPFAVLVSVGGMNALTGNPSSALVRSPQNYFVTPPQGAIDGYFVAGQVFPFRALAESTSNRTRLDIKVFPMKTEALDCMLHKLRLIGATHDHIRGLTLLHGGERQCEPVYEDLCCIGDWDQGREEKATVWLERRR